MSPARTSSDKKTEAKSPKNAKITPKRIVEKDLALSQSSGEDNETKTLDRWNGMKLVKVITPRQGFVRKSDRCNN